MEIDINLNELESGENLIKIVNEDLSCLNTYMNDISLDGLSLKSSELYNSSKVIVNNLISGDDSLDELQLKIKNIREKLININSNALDLFNELDDMSYDEFGNYIDNLDLVISIEDYLNNEYEGKYVKLDNGGYYLKMDNNNEFYISDDCMINDVKLVAYYAGNGGPSGDASYIRSSMEKDGVPSGMIIAISSVWGNKGDNWQGENNIFGQYEKFSNDLQINTISAEAIGFSGGGFSPFIRLNDYLINHPEVEEANVVCLDGWGTAQYNIASGRYPCDELKSRNASIYIISPIYPYENEKAQRENTKLAIDLSNLGFNTTILYDNLACKCESPHWFQNKIFFENNLYRYIVGESMFDGEVTDYSVYNVINGELLLNNYFFSNKNIDYKNLFEKEDNKEFVLDKDNVIEDNTVLVEEKSSGVEEKELIENEVSSSISDNIVSVEEKTSVVEEKEPVESKVSLSVSDNIVSVEEKTSGAEEKELIESEVSSSISDNIVSVEEKTSGGEEKEPVESEVSSSVSDNTVSVEEKTSVVEEKEPVESKVSSSVSDNIVSVEEKTSGAEEKELIENEVSSSISDNNSISNINNSKINSKRLIIPGIIVSGMAAIGAKINNIIKKSKNNNDV